MNLQKALLQLAHASIEEAFGRPFKPDKKALLQEFSELGEKRATFVTLKEHGSSLRGCIGSIVPYRTLMEDVIENAKSAAFEDPRFHPLREPEYMTCTIEISLLTVPQALPYDDVEDLRRKIRPGIDGIILSHGGRKATFLPQVWEELRDFDMFFAHLGMKAGLGSTVLQLHPAIQTYQAEHFEDGEES